MTIQRAAAVVVLLVAQWGLRAAEARTVSIAVLDAETDRQAPCRVHLKGPAGEPIKASELPFWRDHFVCHGTLELQLPPGKYPYEIERGPEWSSLKGTLAVTENPSTTWTGRLERLVDLSKEGWWSGDLHVHRPPEDIELLMKAEDLHFAPVITWWNRNNMWQDRSLPANARVQFDRDRFYDSVGGEDERDGGALLYFRVSAPFDITRGEKFHPHSLVYAQAIRKQHPDVWIDIEKPFWWDFPAWVAAGIGDSVGVANNHQHRSGMFDGEAWGKPRPADKFPGPRGNGLWTQEIYYHLLNCGFRIPPSAGSASGVLPNPVGYNRVYVHVEGKPGWDSWWSGLKAGRCFVSNGPLLRCRAGGYLPGHVFKTAGKELTVDLTVKLTSRDPVDGIEIVHNGKVTRVVRNTSSATNVELKVPDLRFAESGWFLVRAIANTPQTFRFGCTAPYYLEIGGVDRRISKTSAQFFSDWVVERKGRVAAQKFSQKDDVIRFYDDAEKFWRERLESADAE